MENKNRFSQNSIQYKKISLGKTEDSENTNHNVNHSSDINSQNTGNTPNKAVGADRNFKISEAEKKEASARKAVNIALCCVFFLMVIVGGIIVAFHMTNPDKPTYSESEKRNLESAPTLTLATLSDGSFTEDFDKFFSDNFPMREQFVGVATVLKRFRGIRAFDKDAKQVIQGDSDIYSDGDLEINIDENKFNNVTDIVIPGLPAAQDNTETQIGTDTENNDNLPEIEGSSSAVENPPETDKITESVESTPEITDVPDKTADVRGQDSTSAGEQTSQQSNTGVSVAGPLHGEKMDSIYVIGDTAYEYFRGSTKSAGDYIEVINTYAKYIPENVNIYDLIIPTHPEFGLEGSDRTVSNEQKPVIDYIGANLDERVSFVNAYDRIYNKYKEGEYIYFRTDHHWTIRGAYQAYEAFCEKAGFVPVPLESYEKGRIEPFLGTFYSTSKREPALAANPDYVEYFMIDIPCTVTRYDKKGKTTNGKLYYKSVKGESNGYLAFMGGDFAYVNIKTENPNGRKLMLFKESFANPLIGLLAPHFSEVHVADIRYFPYNSINFINQYGITDVLFCNGIMSANSKTRVRDLLGLMNK